MKKKCFDSGIGIHPGFYGSDRCFLWQKETKEDEIVIGVSPSPHADIVKQVVEDLQKMASKLRLKSIRTMSSPISIWQRKRLMPISSNIFRILRNLLLSAI